MKTSLQHSLFVLTLLLLTTLGASAQMKVGNNPTTINANSLLELESTNKGLLLPRLALTSTTAVSPLTAHVAGMSVYNTATAGDVVPGYYYNDGAKWVQIANATGFWRTTGNSSTAPGSNTLGAAADGNYWGTTDAQNLVVGTNGIKRMLFDQRGNAYGGSNTSVTSTTSTNSFAWGSGNSVGGTNSATFGVSNNNQSQYSLVFGNNNSLDAGGTRTNRGTILGGGSNTVSGGESYNSIINGSQNTITGSCFESIITGFQNTVTGSQKVIVSGQGLNVQNATFGITVGGFSSNLASYNAVIGSGMSFSTSSGNSAGFGGNHAVDAQYAFAAGQGNGISTGANFGVALGQSNFIGSNAINSMAIGKGVSTVTSAQFVAGFAGGYNFYTNTANSTGVSLAASGTAFTSISDRRSKEHIGKLNYGLKAVMALRPTQYNYKGVKRTSLGFIAQDVKTVLPEVVEQTTMGPNHDYLGINYTEIIPVLTKAIQELKAENDLVKAKNASLAMQVASLKAGMQELATLAQQVNQMQVALGVKPGKTSPAVTVAAPKTPARPSRMPVRNDTK